MRFLNCQEPEKVNTVFLVHGVLEAQEYFAEKLNEKGFKNVRIPFKSETYKLKLK